jgi:hypothetical protein
MKVNQSLSNLHSNQDLLKLLSDKNIKKRYKNAIIKHADRNLIKAIEDSVYNLLKGNTKYQDSDLQNLTKYKHTLRNLIQKSNLKKKKKILVQRGGFLQYVLPAVITGLSTIVGELVKK